MEKSSIGIQLIILFVFIIILITFIVLLLTFIYQNKLLKRSNKRLIEYNDELNKYIENYRIYKHNLNNKLIAIKSYSNEKVSQLIDDIIGANYSLAVNNNIYNLPNGIKGLVAEKLYNKNYSILVDNKIKGNPFDKMPAKQFNSISECLGIAIDNAIEATKEMKNPIIIIDLLENKDNLIIKVGNNFNNDIDFNKLGEKYYTTKKHGKGLGLYSISKNKLIKEKYEIINDIYYITLEVKKYVN